MKRKKYVFVATFIIIAAVLIALWVGYMNRSPIDEFDGTLVYLVNLDRL